jgi:hypothetical protein
MTPVSCKRLAAAAALVLGATLSPTVQASPVTFETVLSGAAESPANGSAGTGNATVIFDVAAHTMQILVAFSGLTGNTTASHIHCCTAAPFLGNVGVATETPTFSGFPLGVTAGSFSELYDLTDPATFNAPFLSAHGGSTAAAEAALFAGLEAGMAYLNIHTSAFGAGEIRGFLTEAAIGAVPEPTTLLLAGLAVALMGATRRRQGAGDGLSRSQAS